MKILQFGKFYPPVFGGIENVIYEITTGLNEHGLRCDVLCSNDKNEYKEEYLDNYKIFRTKSYGKYFSTSITPQLITKLKNIQNDYDVICVHFPDPMAALALYLSRPKSKIVIHWHSDIIKQKYLLKLYEPLQDWVIKRADLIIGATKNHIIGSDRYNLFLNKYKIITYPFDIDYLKSTVDESLLVELTNKYFGKKVIFGMGRLVYYKGFEYLINSAKYLDDNYLILIGGDGELKEKLEKQIQENNLKHKVKLLGSIEHSKLGTYYKFCDIFCLPSVHRSEMFGIVQLEAMSFGKPIITTKLAKSGICDVNIDNSTGVCVEPMNPEDIANGVKFILEDHIKYEKFSMNCMKRVREVYLKKVVIQELMKCYSQL